MNQYYAVVKFKNPDHSQTSITVHGENVNEARQNAEAEIKKRFFGSGAYLDNIWLHDYGIPSRISVKDAIELPEPNTNRIVCPACQSHEQGKPDEVHDCKVILVNEDGSTAGQCCCWSPEHGTRTR